MTTLLISLVALIAAILLGVYLYTRRTPLSQNYLNNIADLNKVQNDLVAMINEKTKTDSSRVYNGYLSYTPENVLSCVSHKSGGMNLELGGGNLGASVVALYEKNPKLFKIAGECKLTHLLGKIVSVAAWAAKGGEDRKEGEGVVNEKELTAFLERTGKVDWTDIEVWKGVGKESGVVHTNLKNL